MAVSVNISPYSCMWASFFSSFFSLFRSPEVARIKRFRLYSHWYFYTVPRTEWIFVRYLNYVWNGRNSCFRTSNKSLDCWYIFKYRIRVKIAFSGKKPYIILWNNKKRTTLSFEWLKDFNPYSFILYWSIWSSIFWKLVSIVFPYTIVPYRGFEEAPLYSHIIEI